MATECKQAGFEFQGLGSRKVVADFGARDGSRSISTEKASSAGVLRVAMRGGSRRADLFEIQLKSGTPVPCIFL